MEPTAWQRVWCLHIFIVVANSLTTQVQQSRKKRASAKSGQCPGQRRSRHWLRRLVGHHWITLCHIVSLVECCHRTVNPSASALTIRPASECGVTSLGLVLVFTVSIKRPSFTSHVPVRWYVFVRSGWRNHDSSTKPPSAATVFVHRILSGIPAPRGILSSSRNQTPANLSRKASSLSLVILS